MITHRLFPLPLAMLSCLTASLALAAASDVDPLADPPTPAFAGQTAAPPSAPSSAIRQQVIATGLEQPRSLLALPDGRLLVTEGSGTVRLLTPAGELSEPLPGMPAILSVNGRSMNDFVLDTNFAENRRVYFTYLAPAPGQRGGARTAQERDAAAQQGIPFQVGQLARAQLSADYSRIEAVEVIGEIPGRRLIPAADDTLYITTMAFGDTKQLAQDGTSLSGKVLHLGSDGSVLANNPYVGREDMREEIFSLGHRDPDGGAIHPQTGDLWTIEHGPMGGDELNVIRAGNNYGWPVITYGKEYDGSHIGDSAQTGFEQPLYYWYPSVAPSGLLFYTGELFPDWQGDLFLGTMSPTQGKFLVRLELDGERVVGEEHLMVAHDRRVRAVAQGADGALYVLTDSEANDQTNRHFPGEVLRLTPQ